MYQYYLLQTTESYHYVIDLFRLSNSPPLVIQSHRLVDYKTARMLANIYTFCMHIQKCHYPWQWLVYDHDANLLATNLILTELHMLGVQINKVPNKVRDITKWFVKRRLVDFSSGNLNLMNQDSMNFLRNPLQ